MTRVAAVDVGTNSVRLLVADPGEPLTTVTREMHITRLGQAVDASGHFHDDALARTLDRVEAYAERWRELGAQRVRVAATSAVRDAADRDRFVDGVAARVGVRPVVLSAEDEATVSFRGATESVAGDPPYLVLDIGGGSTEFILGHHTPTGMVSRQLGSVRLTEQLLSTDPPAAEHLAAARERVGEHLDAVVADLDAASASTLVGVAGTVTTLAALALGLERYDSAAIHGSRLPLATVRELREKLAAMTSPERAALGPMASGREDVIVAGALILEQVMDRLGFTEALVSEADILDGLALDLLDESG